jgi:hypothetical protein
MATKFIHDIDYRTVINDEELNFITGGDADTLKTAERMAIGKVKKFVSARYDVDQMFVPVLDTDAGTDNDIRDETLVEYCIYFVLYNLFTRIAKRQVPEDRFEQYKEARDFFRDVQQDLISPDWPKKEGNLGTENNLGLRMWSGFPDSHYY